VFPREFRFEAFHLPESRRTTLRRDPNRPHHPRLYRERAELSGRYSVADLSDGNSEDLPPQQLDRPPCPPAVLDRTADDATDEIGGCRMSERPLGPIRDEGTECPWGIRCQRNERPDVRSRIHRPLDRLQSLVRPGEERPEGRQARFALGKKPVRLGERPHDRGEVGSSYAHVVQQDDRRSPLAPKAPHQSGEDLRYREPPTVEAVVESLEQGGGDPVRSSQEWGSDRENPGKRFSERRADPVRDLSGGPSRDRGGA